MPLPPELYDRGYFLSNYCEGAEEFLDGRGLSALKRRQVALLAPRPGMRVLDAGCGRGEVLRACALAGAQVAGVDYSADAVAIARETLADAPEAELVHGSVEELPWPDASFDRILFGDVIEHLDPPQAARALREFRRVLRPAGTLLVHTAPNRLFLEFTWPAARPVLKALGFAGNVDGMDFWISESKRYHVNEQTLHGLRRALRTTGFRDVRAWLDPNVIRGGGHHLTAGLSDSPVVRAVARVGALRPLRLFLSNDLWAVARP
jgi:ubiquinone/menaquinone biosynthesis C-methylase UbiE